MEYKREANAATTFAVGPAICQDTTLHGGWEHLPNCRRLSWKDQLKVTLCKAKQLVTLSAAVHGSVEKTLIYNVISVGAGRV